MAGVDFNDGSLTRGLDVFNRGLFFEAHEVLEDVWRASSTCHPRRLHLQGLVQLAVAFHHQSKGNYLGARSVLERAIRNLTGAEASFPELDLDGLRVELSRWQQHLSGGGPRPALPCLALRDAVRAQYPDRISEK